MATNRIRKGTVLIEYQDKDKKENKVLFEGENIVGRSSNSSNITIKDKSISETHGKIIYEKGVLKIIDTGSKNGIYLHNMDNLITPNIEIEITPKDIVYFAEIKCTFTMDPVETTQEAKEFTTKTFKPILKPKESENDESIESLKREESKSKNELKSFAKLNKEDEEMKKNLAKSENLNEPIENELKDAKITKKQAVPKITKTKKENNFEKFEDEEETKGQEKTIEKESKNEGKEIILEKKSSKMDKKKQEKEKLEKEANLKVVESNEENEEEKEERNEKGQEKKKPSVNKSKPNKTEKEKKKSSEKEPQNQENKNIKNERTESEETKAKGKAKERKIEKKNEANVQSRKRGLGAEDRDSSPIFHSRRYIIEKKILISAFNLSFTPSTKITIVSNWRDSFDLLVMERYSRTFKLLYAICLGIPAVNSNWILNSEYKRAIVPIDQFLLQAPGPEKDLISNSIKIAQSGKKVFDKLKFYLLETDKEFHLPLDQIEALIEAGGGTLMKKIEKKSLSENNETVIITKLEPSEEDFKSIKKLNFINKIYTIELVLQSCLTQSINWEQNKVLIK